MKRRQYDLPWPAIDLPAIYAGLNDTIDIKQRINQLSQQIKEKGPNKMKLSIFWKTVVGLLTVAALLLPIVMFVGFLGFAIAMPIMQASSRAAPPNSGSEAIFLAIMLLFLIINTLWIFLYYGLIIFYVTHGIYAEGALPWLRAILVCMCFFLPFVGMPLYFILLILPAEIPTFARRVNPPLASTAAIG
jgi:hypothetical protein